MRKLLSAVVSVALLLLPLAGSAPVRAQQQNPPSNQSFVAGRYVARNYNYTGIRIFSGNTSGAGAATFSLSSASIRLPDGRTIVPFSAGGTNTSGAAQALPAIPITVGAGTTKETVTPTAVTGCYIGAPQGTCQITATFNNAHGQGEVVTSGSCGIQEALNDAGSYGGGVAEVDSSLNQICGASTVNADLAAAVVVPTATIEDTHAGAPMYWNPVGGLTTFTAPSTLTATTVGFGLNGANTTGGSYVGANTYNVCISYVDLMGQEGPCSASFSSLTAGTGSTNQIGIAAPAAATGAVGYTIYITVTGANTYGLNYKVPLATYSNGVPTGNGVCTLTTIETTTAACAVANTTYGQSGSNAAVSALTVNTSPVNPQTTVVSTTSLYVPQAGGRTTYVYSPSSRAGIPGIPVQFTPFSITAPAGSTAPTVLGTVNLPANLLNIVGRTIEVCGYATTSASTATIENIQVQWDARGQDSSGAGVLVSNQTVTLTASSVLQISFCTQLQGTVSATTVTGGSVQALAGYQTDGIASLSAGASGTQTIKGNTGSLNLFEEARINIIYLHTTGTEGTGLTLNGLTIRAI